MKTDIVLDLALLATLIALPLKASSPQENTSLQPTPKIEEAERLNVLKYPVASAPQLTDVEIQDQIILLKKRISPSRITLGRSKAAPSLIPFLSSGDAWTREQAAQALGRIGDDSALSALNAMALKKEDRYESALVAIGSIGGPMAASYLLEALPNLPIRAKIEVIDILGPIGDNRAVPILCELLRSSVSISVRRHAAMALKYFRDPRSRSALMEIITSNFVIPDKENITQSSAWDIYYESKMSLWHLSGQPEMHDFRFPVIPTQSELIEILIEKSPEPEEGVEAWLRNFEKRQSHHPLSMMPMEPTLFSFVIPIQYKKAHDDLLSRAKHSETAVLVVEELVNRYLRGTDSSKAPKGAAAIKMIVEIGDPAIPALENFIRHGSGGISSNAIECLRQITSNRTK